jgi:transposase-like protein
MRKLLRKHGFAPKRVTTDRLRSYAAAFQHLGAFLRPAAKQSGRKFASSSATARAQDAALYISGIGTTVPERACRRP